jgi:3-hydroxyisobutyrate dehydrogenase
VAFADAPVSGGTNGAEAGALTVMVGADAETFARARPVLAAFGKRIDHVGSVGAGDALKAVNNALLALNILAVGEGMAALVKAGVPARRALEVINASSGRSFVSETLVPERVLTGAWPRSFRLALLEKDVGIAADLMAETGVNGPLTDLCRSILGAARAELGEAADYLDPIRLTERRAGVEIRG